VWIAGRSFDQTDPHAKQEQLKPMNPHDTNETIRAAIETVARQFAEANHQHTQFYRDEIRDLRAIIWAAAASQPNGELIIHERELRTFRPEDCEFETRDDPRNRTKVIRAILTRRGVDGSREEVRK